jgi:hypothetical protein
MDTALSIEILRRDWNKALEIAEPLGLMLSRDVDAPLVVYAEYVFPNADKYVAVFLCKDYDEQPPALDFANPDDLANRGRQWWPQMTSAPIAIENGIVLCIPGTLGYHTHSSHKAEVHKKEIWYLPRVLSIVGKFFRMVPYLGRGL